MIPTSWPARNKTADAPDVHEWRASLSNRTPPQRIDILTSMSGMKRKVIWATKERLVLDGLNMWVIVEMLLANKKASGRPKDLLDVLELERRRP